MFNIVNYRKSVIKTYNIVFVKPFRGLDNQITSNKTRLNTFSKLSNILQTEPASK